MADVDELIHRFRHHLPANDSVGESHSHTRFLLERVALELNTYLPEGREKALVFTKLEEAMFWANAAIAREVK